jgi:lambda family phage portal protein
MARFLLERAIAPILPGLARRRMQARAEFDLLLRAYDGAAQSRKTKEWRAPGSAASAEDAVSLAVLRNRSRDLVRNNPWARKAARQLPAHIVGTGVVPRPTSGAATTRKRALAAWNAWSDDADTEGGTGYAGLQHLGTRTIMEAGECFFLWSPDNVPGGWHVRLMEPDYLDETFHEESRNGSGRIVSGVEFNAAGRRVAYHFFREHPGDTIPMLTRFSERVRVPAEMVDHVYERLRPGQVRGVPWLAASMLRLRDMDDYTEAERWRKKIAAALAAFVTSPGGPAAAGLGTVTTETLATGGTRAMQRIAPGTIKNLKPGEDVKFSSPPTDQGVEQYLRWEMFAICAGLGLPYAELTGDLSNANYGSMRAGKIEFWSLLDVWQWLMVEPMMLRRAWRRVQAASGVPGITCDWGFPKRMWVDPLKDAQAEILAAQSGLESTPAQIGARGYDWRQNLADQAEYLTAAREAGLRLAVDLGAPGAPPAAPSADDAAGAEREDDDEADDDAEADDTRQAHAPSPITLHVNVDARQPPASRTVTMRRDADGNLVGVVTEAPEGNVP